MKEAYVLGDEFGPHFETVLEFLNLIEFLYRTVDKMRVTIKYRPLGCTRDRLRLQRFADNIPGIVLMPLELHA
jgi:hypothetical protein